MDLPNVTVEDCFYGSTVYILNKCVNGMKDPIYLQSCTHAFDITPMSSWQAFANWSMPIFVSYIFARNFFPHAILEELFRLPIYWQAHCAGRQCPNWATSFLSGFDWTSARLEALLASVLQPDVDPEPLVMNVTPSNTDWSEENDDVTPRDMEEGEGMRLTPALAGHLGPHHHSPNPRLAHANAACQESLIPEGKVLTALYSYE